MRPAFQHWRLTPAKANLGHRWSRLQGNSGGPVFEIDQDFPLTHYYLVCIATEFIPLVQATEDFKMQFNSDTGWRADGLRARIDPLMSTCQCAHFGWRRRCWD